MDINSSMSIDVSVCIPVYNEAAGLRMTLEEVHAEMRKLPYSYEIILIDDGSTDDCFEQVKDLEFRLLRHKYNLGGGVARVTGLHYAKGDIIIQTDADGSYPTYKFGPILEKMKDFDLIIGARIKESAVDYTDLRRLMKWILRVWASICAQRRIPDLNSGMRAYRRSLALRYSYLYPSGHSIMSTMTLAFITQNLRVHFEPIEYRVRQGKSSFHPIKDTYNYALTIVRTVMFFDPLRIMMPIVILMFVLSAGFFIRDVFLYANIGDVTTVLAVLSMIILSLALITDQFSRLSKQLLYMQKEYHWKDDSYISEIER